MKPTQESTILPLLRRKGLLGLVVIFIGAGLIFGLFVMIQTPQRPVASAAPRALEEGTTATLLPTSALSTASPAATALAGKKDMIIRFTPTSGPATEASPADGDLVALVNGRPLDRQALQTMAAADRAMAQLLGQSSPDGRDVLERLINGELVWQAAQKAGFTMPEGQVQAELDVILTAGRKSRADLAAGLAAHGLPFDAFMAYFSRLATVDKFAQRQAQARGETVAAYIARLQTEARISFGPAVQIAIQAAASEGAGAAAPSPSPPPAPSTPVPTATARPTPTPAGVAGRGVEIGQLAPDFAAAAVMQFATNSSYSLTESVRLADLLGRPTVLSFWTTWCPYCARQTPVLIEAHQRYTSQGIQFVGIDVKEEPRTVETYVQAHGISYPIGLDSDGQIAAAYRVSGFPTTYFLDAGGHVAAKHVGQLSPEQIDAYLAMLLSR